MRAITAISHLSLCFALTHGNPQGAATSSPGVGTHVRGGWAGNPLRNLRNLRAKPLAPAPSPRVTPPRVPADERAALAFQFDDPLLVDEPTQQQQLQQQKQLQRSFSSSTGVQAVSLVCVALLVRLVFSSTGELGPWRAFLQAYNALNSARPVLCQALVTGFTYVLSDVTAQVRVHE